MIIENKHFNRGCTFEEKLVQALIVDHSFGEQMYEVLDVEYFALEHLKKTAKILFLYYNKYKYFPSYKTLVYIAQNKIDNETVKEQILVYLDKIKNQPMNNDLEFIKEESLEFCRKRKLILALGEATTLIEDKKYDEISTLIQKALQQGSERDLGHIFKDQFEMRMTQETRNCIPTPWPKLNKVLRGGGPSDGELICMAAPTGCGKSHMMVDVASHAVQLGKTVVYYTLELSERDVGNRFDANISKISFDDLIARKEEVRERISSIPGNLIIKGFPAKSASVLTIKNHLNRLKIKGIDRVDLIIIDYAGLIKSLKNYNDKRFEMESVFEEIRGLASELKLPIWTGYQTNRGSVEKEVVTLQDISEAYCISFTCDLFLTFNMIGKQNLSPSSDRPGMLYVAKSRLGPDGIVLPSTINTSISTLTVIDAETTTQKLIQTVEQNEADQLRQRLRQLKQDVN